MAEKCVHMFVLSISLLAIFHASAPMHSEGMLVKNSYGYVGFLMI